MKSSSKFSIDGIEVTEEQFLKKKIYQLNVAGINHLLEPFLHEIKRQHGCIEYKNETGISSVTIHNISQDLRNRIQNEIDQNRLDY